MDLIIFRHFLHVIFKMTRGEGVDKKETLLTDLMLDLVGPQPDAPSTMKMVAVNIYNESVVEEGQLNGMNINLKPNKRVNCETIKRKMI